MATPHDALFRFAFGDEQNAVSMLRAVIPQAAAERIAWHPLDRLPVSFVDEELSDRYADLFFSARLDGREALLYFLFETYSAP